MTTLSQCYLHFQRPARKSAEFFAAENLPIFSGDAPRMTTSKLSCGKLAHSAVDFFAKIRWISMEFSLRTETKFSLRPLELKVRAMHLFQSCSLPSAQITSRCNYKNMCVFHVLFFDPIYPLDFASLRFVVWLVGP